MAWNKCKILHKSKNMEAENMDLEVNYRMIWKKKTQKFMWSIWIEIKMHVEPFYQPFKEYSCPPASSEKDTKFGSLLHKSQRVTSSESVHFRGSEKWKIQKLWSIYLSYFKLTVHDLHWFTSIHTLKNWGFIFSFLINIDLFKMKHPKTSKSLCKPNSRLIMTGRVCFVVSPHRSDANPMRSSLDQLRDDIDTLDDFRKGLDQHPDDPVSDRWR